MVKASPPAYGKQNKRQRAFGLRNRGTTHEVLFLAGCKTPLRVTGTLFTIRPLNQRNRGFPSPHNAAFVFRLRHSPPLSRVSAYLLPSSYANLADAYQSRLL